MNRYLLLKILFLLLISFPSFLQAQSPELDSLQKVLDNYTQEDTAKVNLLIQIAQNYDLYDEKKLALAQQALKIAQKLNFKRGEVESLLELGSYYHYKSNYQKALDYAKKALKIAQEIADKNLITTCLNHIGVIYDLQGDYTKALSCYQQSLAISQAMQNEEGISAALLNVGVIYLLQEDYSKALTSLNKSLEIAEKIADTITVIIAAENITEIYLVQKKYDKAMDYAQRNLKLSKSIDDKENTAYSTSLIGNVYYEKGEYDKSLQYTKQALVLFQEIGDKLGLCTNYIILSEIFLAKKEYNKALNDAQKALKIANELNFLEKRKDIHELLADVYEAKNNYKQAHLHYKQYKALNDSIFSENNIKELTTLEIQYKNDKEKQVLALKQAKKDASQKAEAKEQGKIRNLLILGIVLAILLIFIAVYGFFQKKKVNTELSKQKFEIENTNEELNQINEELNTTIEKVNQQSKEITTTNEELNQINEELNTTLETVNQQKFEIEKTHQKIQASINYASNIQEALLPAQNLIAQFFPEHFILFKPRDVVSGDFYYFKKINHFLVIAVADCTGHGVPGAFLSLLGISFLNEIIAKKEIKTAAQILEHLRKQVKNSLKQTEKGSHSKDGMDIALCVSDTKTNVMQFAGAYNPLYIIRNKELIEIKGTKNPIGVHLKEKSFENHEIQLQKEDSIYLFSDGYVDQFGGEQGRKFMSKKFKELLIKIEPQSCQNQKEILENTLQNWQGSEEQIDDITVLGFRI